MTDAGGELRVDVAVAVRARMEFDGYTWDGDNAYAEDVTYGIADSVLALPALRDLLAERDTLAAQVQAVEGLADQLSHYPEWVAKDIADRIRRALGT